nr:Maf family protein [Planctomycetota bacterium]
MKRRVVLASSSPYRRRLLTRIGVDFDVRVPEVDERPLQLSGRA